MPVTIDRLRTGEITHSKASVSDKIRALDAAGYSRAEIARLLDRRYQQVRNVLEADKLGRRGQKTRQATEAIAGGGIPPGNYSPPPAEPSEPGFFRARLEADGSIRLPNAALRAMGLAAGDTLIGQLHDGQLHLLDAKAALRRAKALVQAVIPAEADLAGELIADRRRAAKEE